MANLFTVVQGKKFLVSTLASITAIWCLGPYVAIAGKMPLGSVNERILASIVACLFFFIFEYKRSTQPLANDVSLPSEIQQELHSLQKTIQDVLRSLHTNVIKSFLFRYKKPWYLVLGPMTSGKSTLLNKADLNIKDLDNLPPMTITTTKFFNWWLSDEAVFIDVGGRYFKDSKEPRLDYQLLFKGFFKLLKRYRSFNPINGLILTINLQELTVNTREQSQIHHLRETITQLLSQFADFPIYLIITRCDTIEGFVEFFEDLGPEERTQLFGMSFPLATTHSVPQLFNEQYNALLTRLNERIIWRLHKEHNIDKIGKIKNFPLQMEFLKNPLAKLLNLILPNAHLNLRGIFFTSAFQKDTPFDNLTKTISSAYDIHHMYQGHRTTPAKNYFIADVFKRIIFPEAKFFVANNSHQRLYLISSLTIVLLTSTCLFFFYQSYHHSVQAIKNTELYLQHVSQSPVTSTSPDEEPLFKHLDQLQVILSELDKKPAPWYTQIGMQQTQKLSHRATALYDQLLTTEFVAYLQRALEIQLQNIQEENTNELYATLKAYLMLGNKQHFDGKFLATWFDNYWHQLSDDSNKQQRLNHHLVALLKLSISNRTLNNALIENKRGVLNSIPPSRLVLTILENHYQRSPIKIMPELHGNQFNHMPTEIPGIFNILNFRDVYYSQIEKACQEITHGDWVLGKTAQPIFSDIMLSQLTTEVKAIYLNEYAVMWSNVLAKVKIEEFQNLTQVISMLDLLNNPQSPLIQLINTIKNNTQPISDSIEFTQQVSSRFLALNALSADVLKNTNQASLLAVKEYLAKIIHSPDIEKASYDAAKVRMENQTSDAITTLLQQSHLLPEPLQSWHTTIAAESWRLVLKNTQNFLNRIWLATVYPQYQAILNNRYPLFKESTMDIALNDFANFFGNSGTMDIFFKNYLQPFVDNSQLYWEWRNVDGQRINIPQATLEMFIRAALIQKMFFPEESKLPAITFSLVPVELDSGLQSFSLDLEGQTVLFQKDNEQIISLNWPGPQPNHTEIIFIDDQGKKTVLSETGPWSWFKMLDKANLESTPSPKHFKLTFNLNGSAVHYELYTNGVVNPLIPGILNAFRCPESL